jgi:hypothetical protein
MKKNLLSILGMSLAAMAMSDAQNKENDVYPIGKHPEMDYMPETKLLPSPYFSPRKHTVMSYAKQNRIAKSKRKSKSYATR